MSHNPLISIAKQLFLLLDIPFYADLNIPYLINFSPQTSIDNCVNFLPEYRMSWKTLIGPHLWQCLMVHVMFYTGKWTATSNLTKCSWETNPSCKFTLNFTLSYIAMVMETNCNSFRLQSPWGWWSSKTIYKRMYLLNKWGHHLSQWHKSFFPTRLLPQESNTH